MKRLLNICLDRTWHSVLDNSISEPPFLAIILPTGVIDRKPAAEDSAEVTIPIPTRLHRDWILPGQAPSAGAMIPAFDFTIM